MLTRRTLLSTLSALVAAPLAKWLPKWEAKSGQLFDADWFVPPHECPDFYVIGADVGANGYTTVLTFESRDGILTMIDERVNETMPDDRNGSWRFKPFSGEPISDWDHPWPVPQEEA
jgi:hypothetical protein